jgi:hypothetical protein
MHRRVHEARIPDPEPRTVSRSSSRSPEDVTPEEHGIPDAPPRSITERLEPRLEMRLPVGENTRLQQALDWVNANDDLYGLWIASNVTAIERLGMTDHGPVHVKIVMNLAVRLLRLLVKGGVEPAVFGTTPWRSTTPRSWWRWRRSSMTWACRSTGRTTRRTRSSWPRTS